VSGWGKDTFGDGGNYQHLLKEVDVPVLDSRDCQSKLQRTRLGPDFFLHPGTLCIRGYFVSSSTLLLCTQIHFASR